MKKTGKCAEEQDNGPNESLGNNVTNKSQDDRLPRKFTSGD